MYFAELPGKAIGRYLDISFLLKFIFFFFSLYYFNIGYNGLVSPEGNYYSPLLSHYLNYIAWLRDSLVATSNAIVHLFGIRSALGQAGVIEVVNEPYSVVVSYECFGLGVSSFWAAFVLANRGSWTVKTFWIFLGVLIIWLINVWRIGLLLVAMRNNIEWGLKIDHHTLFNCAAYLLIFVLINFYLKSINSRRQIQLNG